MSKTLPQRLGWMSHTIGCVDRRGGSDHRGAPSAQLHRRRVPGRRGRADHRGGQPGDGRGVRDLAAVRPGRRRRRHGRRGRRLPRLARHHARRAPEGPAEDRRRLRGARGGADRRRVREHRQADRAHPHRGDPADGGPDPLLRGRRPDARRPADRARSCRIALRVARARAVRRTRCRPARRSSTPLRAAFCRTRAIASSDTSNAIVSAHARPASARTRRCS